MSQRLCGQLELRLVWRIRRQLEATLHVGERGTVGAERGEDGGPGPELPRVIGVQLEEEVHRPRRRR